MDADWLLDLSITVPLRRPLIRDITSSYCAYCNFLHILYKMYNIEL